MFSFKKRELQAQLNRTALHQMSAPLVRASMRAQPMMMRLGGRYAHAHSTYQNIPFSTENKAALAAKCVGFMGAGFALPFVAVAWQWYKPGGLRNPGA
ncbi:hypothetical protein GGX14DRAFT_696269 [Mycena pura]|uniref:Cytochrome c oxidase subunit 8, mitochondrial n=1 Tax=Mycena pura TaxID=153505 RepID=A0AAD6VMR8_9AGAR|nr:hypothetical protein GGX14DRAFT_696269 [Mycena pura]